MGELRRRSGASLPPVAIDGRQPDRLLSSSRRADVYLYPGASGGPAVAVKIFRDPLPPSARASFARAWPRLVRLTEHPGIATVHAVSTTTDDRPYLVMEHCSRPGLAETTAARPAIVPDALRLLIGLGGAVETAHRAGIAHGRVRIENVLTTGYGWPALIGFDTDALLQCDESAVTPAERAADVRGLAVAATELLTGRPIADVSAARHDAESVPAELEALVLETLAATEAGAGPTAAEFAIGLQRIEETLHLPITHLDVRAADDRADDPAALDERTVLSPRRTSGEPSADDRDETVLSARRPAAAADDDRDDRDDDRTTLSVRRSTASVDEDRTVLSPRRAAEEPDAAEPTVLVQRPRREAVVPGRTETTRRAVVPGTETDRYRIRTVAPAPAVTRAPVAAPVRDDPRASRPARRARTAVIVVLGAGVLAIGAAATALAIIIGGGS